MITEMAKTTEQDRRDLSKALTYANFSIFGFVIPFLGWILAGMSLSFIKTIAVTDETRKRVEQVKRNAMIGIIISTVAFVAYSGLIYKRRTDSYKHCVTTMPADEIYSDVAGRMMRTHIDNGRLVLNHVSACDWAKPW